MTRVARSAGRRGRRQRHLVDGQRVRGGSPGDAAAMNTTPSALSWTPGKKNIARSAPSRARKLASARCTRVRAVIGGAPTRAATSS